MRSDPLPRTTERIVLRRLRTADVADFQAYRRDPEVARFQGWNALPDDEAWSFLAEMNTAALLRPGHWCQLGIADKTDDSLIGDIGLRLTNQEDEAEIGFSLGRPAQGKGLGSEAAGEAIRLVFAHSKAIKVFGITDARNTPSVRLLERVGMRKTNEYETLFQGEPCTEYVFAISRSKASGPR